MSNDDHEILHWCLAYETGRGVCGAPTGPRWAADWENTTCPACALAAVKHLALVLGGVMATRRCGMLIDSDYDNGAVACEARCVRESDHPPTESCPGFSGQKGPAR